MKKFIIDYYFRDGLGHLSEEKRQGTWVFQVL